MYRNFKVTFSLKKMFSNDKRKSGSKFQLRKLFPFKEISCNFNDPL